MRNFMVFLAIVFTCLAASCTQRTCPTYTKGIKEVPQAEQVTAEEGEKI